MADTVRNSILVRLSGRIVFVGALLAMIVLSMSVATHAQIADDDIAPPPLRLLSPDEKTKLAAEPEVKRRTKLTLELMEARLLRSEALGTSQDYDQMFVELGGFHGLMDNMLEFLNRSDKDSGRVLNNFKKFEIGLRIFTPRLEVIRRDLPLKYEQYLRILIKNIRAARAKAIEPLFDDTVLPAKKPADLSI